MNLDMDFMDIAGDRLSEMRLLVEGAITLFEDEASILCHLAKDAGNEDARCAFTTSALRCIACVAHHSFAVRTLQGSHAE